MAYQLQYTVSLKWVGAGTAPQTPQFGQVFTFIQAGGFTGGPTSSTFLTADITALTNSMAADAVTQLTAAQTRIQNFASGGA